MKMQNRLCKNDIPKDAETKKFKLVRKGLCNEISVIA